MTGKIFRSILTAAVVALLSGMLIITAILYAYFTGIQKSRLKAELDLAVTAVEQSGSEYLSALDVEDCRFTLVATDGTVLFDSEADVSKMDNHASRKEIAEAFETGSGESERYSSTLTTKTLYSAVRLSDGKVLRIASESMTVLTLLIGMARPLVIVFILLVVLSALLAGRMSKRIVNPLNHLDLEHPLENDVYTELTPLLRKIRQLNIEVDSRIRELRRESDSFSQITGSMKEGLVLLDNNGHIISINNAALRLFKADASCVGNDFITVERGQKLSMAIAEAMKSGHGETRLCENGGEYQADVSRIESEGSVIGAVILIFDVTERVFAERNRREFTANVSHELKTPLQTISGSAELIENGMTKGDDTARFAGKIRNEATRLVALIDDIIRLSRLDEKSEMPFEETDLHEIALETADEVGYAAKKRGVTVKVTGEKTVVCGVKKLLSETLFNLCDNAVKYNTEGGSVTVDVRSLGENAVVTVSDTGIGIPPADISRVFERFYRVDKSHSKESGGTGLGLSIVKHAVACHGGTVSLESKIGVGSVFTVTIPLNKKESER